MTHDINAKEKALRKAKDVEKETMEHQHKLDARGKKKQEKAGMPIIVMKTLKNSAEKSTAKAKHIHKEKTGNILNELEELRTEVPALDKMKISFGNSELHKGKQLITATNLNFGYDTHLLWKENQNFGITSGERIAIKGANGSGKTTLIKLLLDELKPTLGTIQNAGVKSLYIDQDYSLINNSLNVFEQAQTYNAKALQEHEIKTLLTRFLFNKDYWEKPCSTLSGGEKMRLLLCCLAITKQTPDLIILDEPTNNLDLQNTEILTAAINNYRGTLLVISHDKHFLEQVGIERGIVI